MSMRKFPRVGATAASALVVVLAASAFAKAPAAPAAAAAAARATAPARATASAAPLLTKVQPGGPIAATGGERAAVAAFGNRTTNVVSSNWAGYVAGRRGLKFRSVKATFFVPYLDCANSSSPITYSGHWVGLDGAGSSTVEQDGILAACEGTKAVYSAWYEMFPQPPVYAKMNVRAGNAIVASVDYSRVHHRYTLSVSNLSTGAEFLRTRKCPAGSTCRRLSAEAISEAPSSGTSILPLANFRAESFSDIRVAAQNGKTSGLRSRWWNTLSITTEGAHGAVMDQPTSIARGMVFDDYWMAEG
jgi:hypothetical protein